VLERLVTGAARVLCAVLGLALLAALATTDLAVWKLALTGVATPGRLAVLAAAAIAGGVLAWRGLPPGRLLVRIPAPVFVGAAVVIALASGVWAHRAIEKGVPDVPDEMGYLHMARTFADGHLTAPSPPAREFFYTSWAVHDRDRWYAVFPPGYGVLLAVGTALGAPGLVNAVLGALLVPVLFLLARAVARRRDAATSDDDDRAELAARVAVVLYLASWFRLVHAGSFMAHPTAALLTALVLAGAWTAFLVPGRRPRLAAAIAGAGLAALVATRQLDAVVLAVALAPALVVALLAARERRALLVRAGVAAACGAPILAAYLAYNGALTGAALLPPQQRYMEIKERRGDCFRLGFGPGVGECPLTQNTHFGKDGFTPRHAAANTDKRLDAWNRYSFGWAPLAALPALALLAAAIAGGAAARRRAVLGAVVAATMLGYGLFFYHGVTYGARFYYSAFPVALILSALVLVDLAGLPARVAIARGALAGLLPALLVVGLGADRAAIEAHAGKRGRSQDGKQIAALTAPGLGDALIFIDSMVLPAAVTEHPADIPANRPLVVKDLGDAANAGLARLFPDRRPVRLSGTRLVPLRYRPDAPMRHEGGALYPLDRFSGGFPDRIPASSAGNVALSLGEALRFTIDRPAASFSFPIWVLAADAGPLTLDLRVVHHRRSPPIDVAIDGVSIATAIASRGDTWSTASHPVPATLTAGLHWVTITAPTAARGDSVLLDYVELRPLR
jgi:hypothetical protein